MIWVLLDKFGEVWKVCILFRFVGFFVFVIVWGYLFEIGVYWYMNWYMVRCILINVY